jgi:hypothetical protein
MKDTFGMAIVWTVITVAMMAMAALIGDVDTVLLGVLTMGVLGVVTIGTTFVVELCSTLSSISWFWIAFPFERHVHLVKNGPTSVLAHKTFYKDFLGFTVVGQYK